MKKAFIKDYFWVFILGAILSLAFNHFFNKYNQNNFFLVDQPQLEDAQQILNQFRRNTEPITEINFSQLYGSSQQFQILHPLLTIKKNIWQKSNQSCSDCQPAELNVVDVEAKKNKREILNKLIFKGEPLPVNFFETPPYVDQWGISFAYIISLYNGSKNKDVTWVINHLAYFKISELKSVLNEYNIKHSQFSIIATLSDVEVEAVVRGENLILTSDYVLIKDQTQYGFSPLSYVVYNIQKFNSALKKEKYEVVLKQKNVESCSLVIGNSCWNYSSSELSNYLRKYAVLLVSLIGLIIFIGYLLFIKNLYDKQRTQIRNRLSLQILSHEFRTPVSSMLLMMERMSAKQSQLDTEGQDMMTRLSGEVYKLQRIVEVSKSYLQAEGRKIQFNPVMIHSVNAWINDFLDENQYQIKPQLLEHDKSIVFDPFWFKFILSNLIQNAFTHGAAPVRLKMENRNNRLTIHIMDAGTCEFKNLKKMTSPYAKRSGSSGMGLGLSMINLVSEELNVKISYSHSPTTFTVTLNQSLIDLKVEA